MKTIFIIEFTVATIFMIWYIISSIKSYKIQKKELIQKLAENDRQRQRISLAYNLGS